MFSDIVQTSLRKKLRKIKMPNSTEFSAKDFPGPFLSSNSEKSSEQLLWQAY